jgi:AAA domain
VTITKKSENSPAATRETQIREWLDACVGDHRGKLQIATGDHPENVAGKYKYPEGHWHENAGTFAWPRQADQAVARIAELADSGVDVFCCPYLHNGRRAKGGSVARDLAHCDADSGTLTASEVESVQGAFAVASGSPGHGHVYVALTRSLSVAEHQRLCKAMIARFNGDRAKWTDELVLRPVGSLNFKPTVMLDPPQAAADVTWLVRPTGIRRDPDELLDELVDGAPKHAAAHTAPSTPASSGEINLADYPTVAAALANKDRFFKAELGRVDRSDHFMAVLAACVWAKLTSDQARQAVRSDPDLAAYMDEKPADFDRVWIKLLNDMQLTRRLTGNDGFWQPDSDTSGTTSPAPVNGQPAPGPAAIGGAVLLDDRMRSGTWLNDQQFPPLKYVVPGLIPAGAGFLVGPPKKGKSFLVAGIGLSVAVGGQVLGCIQVEQRPVLYLALEDGDRRLQKRFRDIAGQETIPELMHRVIKASPAEVFPMMSEFVARNPTGLVILDTLGKVKPPRKPNQDSYQADYEIGCKLKECVEDYPDACLWVVHHTRKMASDDFLDSVSGTQGLAGAVDFVTILKRQRKSNDGVLAVTGRDVLEDEYALRAEDGIRWKLDGDNIGEAAAKAREREDEKRTAATGQPKLRVAAFVTQRGAQTTTIDDVLQAEELKDLALSREYVRQILWRCDRDGLIISLGRGAYRAMPEGS